MTKKGQNRSFFKKIFCFFLQRLRFAPIADKNRKTALCRIFL